MAQYCFHTRTPLHICMWVNDHTPPNCCTSSHCEWLNHISLHMHHALTYESGWDKLTLISASSENSVPTSPFKMGASLQFSDLKNKNFWADAGTVPACFTHIFRKSCTKMERSPHIEWRGRCRTGPKLWFWTSKKTTLKWNRFLKNGFSARAPHR